MPTQEGQEQPADDAIPHIHQNSPILEDLQQTLICSKVCSDISFPHRSHGSGVQRTSVD